MADEVYLKNTKRIRLFGGNELYIKMAAGWKSLGHLISGTLEDKTDSQEITFADGSSIDIDGKRRVKLSVTLAQTSKYELELIDILRDGLYPVYYSNGIVDGKKQLFYFPRINIVPSMTIKSPDNPQNIVLEMSVQPMDVNVPNTIMEDTPPIDYAALFEENGASKNKYYLILEG
jgi:hypothetical protein